MSVDREPLQRALGHRFGDPALLERALTHRSASSTHNERLEYLGDALLNLAVADLLYTARSSADEGDLSRLRASLVREETLAAVARRLSLGESVQLGPGELRSGGFRRDSILADALEAILGAVYLDAGFEIARALCARLLGPEIDTLPAAGSLKDAKTRLQEWLQAIPRPLPEYAMLREEGPPHRRQFTVRCTLADVSDLAFDGSGPSRRLAEQAAAERMLQHLLALT